MINKEDLLNSEFLKQFKTGEELDGFLKELFVRGTEQILQDEMDNHLGYSKHALKGDNPANSRNGYGKKHLKSEYGNVELNVPRDRNASFDPQIVPKRCNTRTGIENLVISLYAKGMSNSDIEQQLMEL